MCLLLVITLWGRRNSMVFVASGYSDTDMIVLRVTVPIG